MFRKLNNQKIGNILIYLSSKIPYLSMTKALKLLYIIDEESVRMTGSPVTWLDYKVWKMGPVAVDIYNEIKGNKKSGTQDTNGVTLEGYVKFDRSVHPVRNQEEVFIKSASEFNKGIFSKFEIKLMDSVVDRFGQKTPVELIDYLHEEDSLWHKIVVSKNLELRFKESFKTNYKIDFSELIKDNPMLRLSANSARQALNFQEGLA